MTWICGAAFVLTACGTSPPEGMIRFIESNPEEVLSIESFFESKVVDHWAPGNGLAAWHPAGNEPAMVEATEGGLLIPSGERPVHLEIGIDYAASEVDSLQIVLRRPAGHQVPVRVAWAREGEGWSRERTAVGELGGLRRQEPFAARLSLHGHPEWTGRIRRLRLTFPPRDTLVESISLTRDSLSEERLAEVANGFKAEVADELRNVLPGVPGRPVDRALRIPAGAHLRLSYAALGDTTVPMRFAVYFISGVEPQTLFETTLQPGTERQRGWLEASVSLEGLEGEEGRLRLETEVDGDLGTGIGLWANPRVVSGSSAASGPNVVLISVDTLRPDRMSAYGYQFATTPHLDRWIARRGAVFETAVAQSPWTLPSHVSMLTGLDPFHHGVNYSHQRVPASLETSAEMFRSAGYRTLAITGGTLLHPKYGLTQGFDRYWYFSGNRAHGEELATEVERALSWLEEQDDTPFFLFFHTYEVHAPYRSRQPYYQTFTDLPPVADIRIGIPEPDPARGHLWPIDTTNFRVVEPESLREEDPEVLVEIASAAYDSGVAYMDELLAPLLRALDAEGRRETALVFTSDHGEMLGEHGLLNHRYLYEENIRTPLFIAAPNGEGAGARIDQQVRSVDIVPTLLDLAGLEIPGGLDGRSLVPLLEGRADDVPAEAWTYVPESNYGVSLRLDSGLKYVYNDTAWSPLQGRDRLALPDDESEDLESSPERASLRRRVERALGALPGYHLRFVNNGEEEVEGTLTGPAIRFNTVKSIDLPCDCVEFTPLTIKFRVPVDTSFTLAIGGAGPEPLTLRAEPPEGSERVQLTPVENRRVIGWHETVGWRELPGQRRPPAYLEVGWHGPLPPSNHALGPVDEDLLRRLRALGYVR